MKKLKPKNKGRASYNEGSIIIFAILMLTSILVITLTLTRIFLPKVKAITEATDSIKALYAADSALEWCLYVNRQAPGTPPTLNLTNGATWVVYQGSTATVADCTEAEGLDHRAVGSFSNVTRSFQLEEL